MCIGGKHRTEAQGWIPVFSPNVPIARKRPRDGCRYNGYGTAAWFFLLVSIRKNYRLGQDSVGVYRLFEMQVFRLLLPREH
jgi:hypothetical protein